MRIAGSIALAVSPISRLLTRQMYFAIETRSAWDDTIHFSPSLLIELKFWFCNIDCFNGYSIRPPLATHTVVFSDASDVAFGGFSASLDGTVISGMWEPEALAMDIFNLCLVNNIVLEAQWIPRSLNERADLLSRFIDKDDWSINASVFRDIDAKWGPHTIDRFASHYNAQVPRFNSKFASPGCSGVDALSQDWRDENNWVCPVVSAIVPSIRALSSCSGYGTLIVP